VSFIVSVALGAVFCLSMVVLFYVLCLIIVPLSPGKNTFAVKLNIIIIVIIESCGRYVLAKTHMQKY
jgi:hypothetical protein